MRRKTKISKRVEDYANRVIKISRAALLYAAVEDMYNVYLNTKNRLPYDHISNLLDELKAQEDWVTRSFIKKALMKYKAKMKNKILEEKTQQPSSLQGTSIGCSTLG